MLRVVLLVFCIILCSQSAANFTVQVTCEPCTISCSRANCYRIKGGDGYDNQICVGNYSCPLTYSSNVTITKCERGGNGVACSTNLCYESSAGNGCINDFSSSFLYSCSSPYYFWLRCQTCENIPCDGKCVQLRSSFFEQTYQSCYGSSCGFLTQNLTISPCSGGLDWLGRKCSCCYTYSIEDMQNTMSKGLCTNTNNILSNSSFTSYAKNRISQTFQNYHGVFLVTILIVLVIMY